MPTVRELIGHVAARNNVRVDEVDPIFAVSTINRLMLEETLEALVSRIQTVIKDLETSAFNVEGHAGKLFAQEVQLAATAWRYELAADIKAAGMKSCELVNKVALAQSRPSVIRWASSGLVAALILFGCGILVGMHIR